MIIDVVRDSSENNELNNWVSTVEFLGAFFRRETSRKNKQKEKLVNEMWVELGPRTNSFKVVFLNFCHISKLLTW